MWDVRITKKCEKSFNRLPTKIKNLFLTLLRDLIESGPTVKWPNYGKIKGAKSTYHCHIKKGKPTYVVVWEVKDKQIQLMEVIYVGTHEKAPY